MLGETADAVLEGAARMAREVLSPLNRSGDAQGARLTNPPLALDLHYLLTAYGSVDLNAEILLGFAMDLLNETPMLSRDTIRRSLSPTDPVQARMFTFNDLPMLNAVGDPCAINPDARLREYARTHGWRVREACCISCRDTKSASWRPSTSSCCRTCLPASCHGCARPAC